MHCGRWTAIVAVTLAVAGCGSDSTGTDGVTLADLVGTWHVTKWECTNEANTSQKVNLATVSGSDVTLTVATSGAYTLAGSFAGEPWSASGSYAVQGGTIVVQESGAEPQSSPFTLTGDTWTISQLEGDWDFDNDGTDDPARLVIVFTRQ
ncbi:MAG TPA: hypothetical protein VFK36_03720 [Gemmatimonadales bacterium]|nr:hypothetical protein [Gemmatimonadales bacterium]